MLSTVINRSIHQRRQAFIHESKHSLYTVQALGSRSTEVVFTIYLSVYLYLLDIPIDDFTVTQLPFCNSSTTRQMVGFCVHKRAELWLSLRAGAHSYKNK